MSTMLAIRIANIATGVMNIQQIFQKMFGRLPVMCSMSSENLMTKEISRGICLAVFSQQVGCRDHCELVKEIPAFLNLSLSPNETHFSQILITAFTAGPAGHPRTPVFSNEFLFSLDFPLRFDESTVYEIVKA